MKRLLYISLMSLTLMAAGVVGIVPSLGSATASATTGDCDDNAVIRCGVFTTSALQSNYKGDVKAAYNHFGITDGMINGTSATIKNGYVTKSGDVTVDGKIIATDAMSAGRQNMPGSTTFTAGGTTFYKRSTSVSFNSDTLAAFVMVDKDGTFLGAVIKTCGNPVSAKPKVVKVPSAVCNAVTVHKLSRTTFRFTGEAATKDGATISGYVFKVNSPSFVGTYNVDSTATSATTNTLTFKTPGTYKVVLTVKTSVGQKTDENCRATFVVEKEPEVPAPTKTIVCNPETGQKISIEEKDASKYKPIDDVACQPKVEPAKVESTKVERIADTGPADYLIGATSLGSLTAAGYYLHASRQRLAKSLKK